MSTNSTITTLEKYLPLVTLIATLAGFPGAAAAATIVTDIEGIVQGVSDKDPVAVANAASATIADANSAGIISGSLVDEAANDLAQFSSFVADVKANQVGIIRGNTSLFGVKGMYAFIPSASEQGQSLGAS